MQLLLTNIENHIHFDILDNKERSNKKLKSYYNSLKHFGLRKQAIIKKLNPLVFPYSNNDTGYQSKQLIFELINKGIDEHGEKYPHLRKSNLNHKECLLVLKSMYETSEKRKLKGKIRLIKRIKSSNKIH